MTNPFVLDVRGVLHSPSQGPELVHRVGPSPVPLGGAMLAVAEGADVTVDATVTNLGQALLVNADVAGVASGTCARCLSELHPELHYSIAQVFSATEGLVQNDDPEDADAEDEVPLIVNETVDITQAVVDEVGLDVPFSPVCEDYGQQCSDAIPRPDGISEEQTQEAVDPRWAGLAKFAGAESEPADAGAERQDDSEDTTTHDA